MVFFYFKHCEGYNHCSSGKTFFWRLRRWWITCWKSNIFIRKNYFVFIIYAQIYLQNFKTFDAIFFWKKKFTKITFFQAVILFRELDNFPDYKFLEFFKLKIFRWDTKWIKFKITDIKITKDEFFCLRI